MGERQFQFKLVLLGESAVGKSSLVLRFVSGNFQENQTSTVGACFLTQEVCLNEVKVKFDIWDTAGQERFATLAPMYYRGAQAAIVVFDLTSYTSFMKAQEWVRELQRKGHANVVIALAGNKSDLSHLREVTSQQATDYADENGALYFETSAKNATNVNELFVAIAKKLPLSTTKSPSAHKKIVNLTPPTEPSPAPTPEPTSVPEPSSVEGGCCN
eukprot:TRINITY_DN2037_c0_g1_i10.p1 TRINITY_DN2037_c0_g1~~TRINITY_DN2037_c0_g1_i10.p1  ORF type:complete len:215 (-),score=34.53 TRINITY_DN2037_c0_g1_i10:205-849(-)